jgi:hypothetical protein
MVVVHVCQNSGEGSLQFFHNSISLHHFKQGGNGVMIKITHSVVHVNDTHSHPDSGEGSFIFSDVKI